MLLSSLAETQELFNELIRNGQYNQADELWANVQRTKVDRVNSGDYIIKRDDSAPTDN